MSSHPTDEEDCPPCVLIGERMKDLCKILGEKGKDCKDALDKMQKGELNPEDVFADYFSDMDESKIEALREWATNLGDELNARKQNDKESNDTTKQE